MSTYVGPFVQPSAQSVLAVGYRRGRGLHVQRLLRVAARLKDTAIGGISTGIVAKILH